MFITPLILWLTPLAPLMGIVPIMFHVGSVWTTQEFLRRRRPILFRRSDKLLLVFLVSYLLSLLVAAANGADGTRIVGSLYNLSLWAVLFLLLLAGVNNEQLRSRQIARALWGLFMVCGAFGVTAWLLWRIGFRDVRIDGLFGSDGSALVRSSNRIVLLQRDWLYGASAPRSSAFAPYPTAFAAVTALLFIGVVGATAEAWRPPLVIRIVGYTGACFALYLSGSRTTIAALAIAMFYLASRQLKTPLARVGTVCGVVIAVALLAGGIIRTGASVVDARSGSSETRFRLYSEAVDAWQTSPVIGIGYKPLHPSGFPIGSHSTYIGVMLRSGVVGLFLVVGAAVALTIEFRQMRRLSRAAKRRCHTGLSLLLFIALWATTEDLDAPQLVTYLSGFMIGSSRLGASEVVAIVRGSRGIDPMIQGREASLRLPAL